MPWFEVESPLDRDGRSFFENVEAPTRGAARYKVARRFDWLTVGEALRLLKVRKLRDLPTPDPSLEDQATAWNAAHPVGTIVRYWRFVRSGPPTGTGRIKGPATVLGKHTVVAWIDGCSGCVALTHVEAL